MRLSRLHSFFLTISFVLVSLTASGQVINLTIAPNNSKRPTTADAARTRVADNKPLTGAFTTIFGGGNLTPKHQDQNISYALDPSKERFVVYVPDNYTGATPFGLVVFTAPADIAGIPFGWESVLKARNLMFIAAENSGNDRERARRMGLAVLGALEMMKHYQIDPSRVYASGFSGGARVAGFLGFFQSDLFRGTIQNSGADFYRPVAKVYATSPTDTAGQPYGIFHATAAEVEAAKRVRFVLVTGSNDFRRGNILDVYYGGFAKSGIESKLLDVPGLGHDICDGQTFSAALDFIEGTERH
jgi:predicted esterase